MEPIAALRATADEHLPPAVRDAVLAMGDAAVPELIAILRDESLADADSPAEGWPPIHAVDLLADLNAVCAIEPMLDLLEASRWDDIVHDRLLQRLGGFGAEIVEPAFRRLEAATRRADDVTIGSLVTILASAGVRDERIFRLLCDAFDEDAPRGAMLFAEYGDPRALPRIRARCRASARRWRPSTRQQTGDGASRSARCRTATSASAASSIRSSRSTSSPCTSAGWRTSRERPTDRAPPP